MERFQSTWEHQVRFNLSESGVHPLSVRELVGDGAALDAVLDQPLIYTQTNGTEALRTAIAGALPRRHREPRRGDQRRRRGQLPRRLVSGPARRRGGDARAHLHADPRARSRLRRQRPRVAAGRGSRGWTLAAGSRPARLAGRSAHAGHRAVHTQQPDRGPPDRRRARRHRRGGRAARLLDRVRRDLPRRRARRRGVAVDVGPCRAGHGHQRTVEGLRPAGPARRAGWCRRRRWPRRCGRITTTPPSPPAH